MPHRPRVLPAAVAALILTSAAGCAPPAPSTSPSAPAKAAHSRRALPTRSSPGPKAGARTAATTKILTIVVENHSLSQMRTGMPYLDGLAKRYGYATDYRAVRHPSLPNYLAIAFGTTAGVTDDGPPASHHVRGNSIFSLAGRAGTGARLNAESMRTRCQKAPRYPYAVKHNPWAYGSAGCATGDVPAGTPRSGRLHSDARTGSLPCAGMLIPNLVSDAHDSSLRSADRYLKTWLPTLMAGPDFRSGHLAIVVTADEDDRSSRKNRVLTVVLSRSVHHAVVRKRLTHYSLTRLYNTVCHEGSYLGKASTAPSMRTAFHLRLS